ncbi:MAG: hypothetical protein GC160_26370 [Acidobacteria bacterium]|nr:hypothetical protein [Acidobacteriota bacterium]
MRWLRAGLLAALTLGPAFGQCAMCREAARSQRQQAVDALNSAILLLGAPPAVILFLVGRQAWRRRDS